MTSFEKSTYDKSEQQQDKERKLDQKKATSLSNTISDSLEKNDYKIIREQKYEEGKPSK